MIKASHEVTVKQQVNQYVFDIRVQARKKAYWNATKLAHELFKFLDSQPYIESDNPPMAAQEK